MSGRHFRNFNLAIQASQQSDMAEKHGAVAVYGGKVIGTGCNSSESLDLFNHNSAFGCYLHAELAALNEIKAMQRKTVQIKRRKKGDRVQRILFESCRPIRSANKVRFNRSALHQAVKAVCALHNGSTVVGR